MCFRLGMLEHTLMTKFCQAGNLKALLSKSAGIPSVLDSLAPILQPVLAAQVRRSLVTDIKAQESLG